ncbi:MAG: hypothetical protein KDD60_07140, partial [Bdellovibrionales bacterium]|nr:hypothetical protein [Bdellovibrionales bacterium]
ASIVLGLSGSPAQAQSRYDLNGDLCVNFSDLLPLITTGLYESGRPATFAQGDFDGNGTFGTADLVQLLSSPDWNQCFEPAPPPSNPVDTLPEEPRTPVVTNPNPTSGMKLGTNLDQPTYYGRMVVFNNRMLHARSWVAQRDDCWSFNCGPEVPVDFQSGYPRAVPFGDGYTAKTTFTPGDGSGNFNGTYTLQYKGTGALHLWGAAVGSQHYRFSQPGTYEFAVTNDGEYLMVEIQSSAQNDPVRDIQILLPGVSPTQAASNPFYTGFIQDLRNFGTVRYMDFTNTNLNRMREWSERTPKGSMNQGSDNGAAFEWVVELANRTDTNAWINIPTYASDDFVRNLAVLFRDQLKSPLKVYIEYSNEVWNQAFEQGRWADAEGRRLGFSYQPTAHIVAKRSAEIFKIFEDVYGTASSSRIVKVLPTQGASWGPEGLGRTMMKAFNSASINGVSFNPTGVKADAIAINPYFGGKIVRDAIDTGRIYSMTSSALLTESKRFIENDIGDMLRNYRDIARDYNLTLVAYEGGQHLAAHTEASRNSQVVQDLLYEANRRPEMEELYTQLFNMWKGVDAGEFMHFIYVKSCSKFGCWGSKEYQTQPLESAPKARAIVKQIEQRESLLLGVEQAMVAAIGNNTKDVESLRITLGAELVNRYRELKRAVKRGESSITVRRMVKRLRKTLVKNVIESTSPSEEAIAKSFRVFARLQSKGVRKQWIAPVEETLAEWGVLMQIQH